MCTQGAFYSLKINVSVFHDRKKYVGDTVSKIQETYLWYICTDIAYHLPMFIPKPMCLW